MPKRIEDDEVLDWWEAYEEKHWTVGRIAVEFGRDYRTVRCHFIELGVIAEREPWPSEQAEAISSALARIDVDAFSARRHLPYARSLPHVKPMRNRKIVQSARQRAQDRMATGLWRTLVRQDMKRAGIL